MAVSTWDDTQKLLTKSTISAEYRSMEVPTHPDQFNSSCLLHNQRGDALVAVMIASAVALSVTLGMIATAAYSFREQRSSSLINKAESQILQMKQLMGSRQSCIATIGAARAAPSVAKPIEFDAFVSGTGQQLFKVGQPITSMDGTGVDRDLTLNRILLRPYNNSDAESEFSSGSRMRLTEFVITFEKSGDVSGARQVSRSFPIMIDVNTGNEIIDCIAGNGWSSQEIRQEISAIGRCPSGEFIAGVRADGSLACRSLQDKTEIVYELRPGAGPGDRTNPTPTTTPNP